MSPVTPHRCPEHPQVELATLGQRCPKCDALADATASVARAARKLAGQLAADPYLVHQRAFDLTHQLTGALLDGHDDLDLWCEAIVAKHAADMSEVSRAEFGALADAFKRWLRLFEEDFA